MSVVMTNKEFCEKLKHIANDLVTSYRNIFPYNLGYCYAKNKYSWDCWNLPKSLIWGWQETNVIGSYAKPNPATGLGDWTGGEIMKHCTDVSTDFSTAVAGEFMMNAQNTHAGIYVGEHQINGYTYNVIEATTAFGGGVVWSYVTASGRRYSRKGGYANGSWAKHGKLPWIEYIKEVQIVPLDTLRLGYKGDIVRDFICIYNARYEANIPEGYVVTQRVVDAINWWYTWINTRGITVKQNIPNALDTEGWKAFLYYWR